MSMSPFDIRRSIFEARCSTETDNQRANREWPGVEAADVEIGDVETLAAKCPASPPICAHSSKIAGD